MKLSKTANQYSNCGLNYAQNKHTSYFLDELNYNKALSLKHNDDKKDDYEDYLNLAYYLAKTNHNEKLLTAMNR